MPIYLCTWTFRLSDLAIGNRHPSLSLAVSRMHLLPSTPLNPETVCKSLRPCLSSVQRIAAALVSLDVGFYLSWAQWIHQVRPGLFVLSPGTLSAQLAETRSVCLVSCVSGVALPLFNVWCLKTNCFIHSVYLWLLWIQDPAWSWLLHRSQNSWG